MIAQRRTPCLVMFVSLLLVAVNSWAQTSIAGSLAAMVRAQTAISGSIAGVARDTSGAVVPGVTVEAASPALIEKTRTATTDSQGVYRIVDLRPGLYTVTFTLPGFATVKREGLDLTAGFTATVNADMRVGALEETVTVTGATPVVDVQNVMQAKVFSRDVLDSLPVGKSAQAYAPLIPGATVGTTSQDVGGVATGSSGFTVHGGTGDMRMHQAGISFDNPLQQGGNLGFGQNRASTQEVTIEVGGIGAESETGGVQLNLIPKEGGNNFSTYIAGDYGDGNLQTDNLTPELFARGLRAANGLRKTYDANLGVGGPIIKNSLWFYTAHRWVGSQRWTSTYFNKTQDSVFYTPDYSRPYHADNSYRNNNLRLTWQASPKNKISFLFENQKNCICGSGQNGNNAPEANGNHYITPNRLAIGTWTYPATSRLLFEVVGSAYTMGTNQLPLPGVLPTDIAIQELSNGFNYRSRGFGLIEGTTYATKRATKISQRFAVSYVTGSHSFKTGVLIEESLNTHTHEIFGDETYRFRMGVPVELALWATPWDHSERLIPIIGTYAQDQWTLRRWTLNLGARFDYLNGYVPEQHLRAGTFVPARNFGRVDGVPHWQDFSPRLGVAYDLFGNSKTALKVSIGRYIVGEGSSGLVSLVNPANQLVASATRAWTDNGDFVPQENELGPLSNSAFGSTTSNTHYADEVVRGFGKRAYTWQTSASVQHELFTGFAVNFAYFRTTYGNFTVTDNLLVKPSDFDEFCITVPVNTRLPAGGGNRICGLYDVKPTLFGKVDSLVIPASNVGKQTQIFNGVDATLNARFRNGAVLSGGLSSGSTTTDNCFVVDSPQQARPGYCHVSLPWSSATQLKLFGAYPLPWGFQASGTFQNLPGVQILANYVATRAEVFPSLGRNLNTSTVSIPIIEPGAQYGERINQLDIRLSKGVKVGHGRAQGIVDIYNALNSSSILAINTTYGTSWQNVQQIMAGRIFKFGTQIDF